MNDVLKRLRELAIVPVVVIDEAEDAVPLAAALVDGGLPCAEITFRTPSAAEALRRIAAEFPDMLLGAGTVLTPAVADEARDAGARFIVAPGLNPRVVEHCVERGVPMFPGVCTPTEVEAALAHGLGVVKFFPAEAMGGLSFLKAIAAPYGGIEFIPTGGITADNLASYLAFDRVLACGGSWMVPQEWIRQKLFDRVRQAVREAVLVARPFTGDR